MPARLIYTCIMHHESASEGLDLIKKLETMLPDSSNRIIGDFIVTYTLGKTTGKGTDIADIMHEIHETEHLEALFDEFGKPYVILTSDHFRYRHTIEAIKQARILTAKTMLEDIYRMKKHYSELMKLVRTQSTGSALADMLTFVTPIFASLLAEDYNIGMR